MSRPSPGLTATLTLAAALAGCGTTVTLVPEPLACAVSDDVLAQHCAAPAALADGASYGDVIKAGIDDRSSLRLCARHDQLLADALRECNAAIERYKASLREINAKAAARP